MSLRYVLLLLLSISYFHSSAQNEFVPSSVVIEEALTMAQNNETDNAITLLNTVDRSDTAYPLALLRLTTLYISKGDHEKSIAISNEGLSFNSEYEESFYNQKAKAYIDKEEYAKGRETLREGLKLYPYSTHLNYNMGFSYLKDKKYDSSAVYLENCIRNDVYFSSAHYLMGVSALAQGHSTKGLMAWSFYLQIKPDAEGSLNILRLMENVSKNITVLDQKELTKEFQDNKDFAYLDQLVEGLVAVDKGYKTKVSVDAAVVKQMQLIIDQFKYNPSSNDFYMRMYGPLFETLQKNAYAEPYIYVLLSSLDNSKVVKWKKKNQSRIKEMFAAEDKAVSKFAFKKELDLPNQKGTFNSWYSSDRSIYALGNTVDDNFQKKTGYWRYFHPDHSYLVSEGRYNDAHGKEGEWTYYYTGKRISKKETYKNDTLQGPTIFYEENGNIATEVNYVKGKAEGTVTMYYPGGAKKELLSVKGDLRDGPAKYYYCSGQLSDDYTYKEGEIDGLVKSYYESGAKRQEINFSAGKYEGDYITYHENGKVQSKGMNKAGKSVGKWVYYHKNGQVSNEGEYDEKGDPKGEWKSYYENGKLSQQRTFVDGKSQGDYKYFDKDGILHYTVVMNKGETIGYSYYDKQGKVLSTGSDKKGDLKITGYDPKGVKTFDGQYEDGLDEGEWKYYYPSGKLKRTRTYKKGVLEGPQKDYTERGELVQECSYKAGNMDGYFVEYFINGKKSNEGYLRDGEEQGAWKQWYANGKLERESYYMDGALQGYKIEYATTGQKASEAKMVNDLKYIITAYDTSGNVRSVNDFSKGSGKWIEKYANGKPKYEANVSCHTLNGPFKWFHPDGKISTEQNWKSDQRDGAFKTYYENGKLRTEGAYDKGQYKGSWKWYHENGQLETAGRYVDGDKDSLWVYYHDNGKKEDEITYKNDEPEGTARSYDPLGELMYEKHYKDGEAVSYSYNGPDGKPVAPVKIDRQNGQVKTYYANGKMSSLVEYKDGSVHGKDQAWHSNGQVYFDNTYEKGERVGTGTVYYANGNKKVEANFIHGFEDGVMKYYREDGTLEKTETYVLGELNGKTEYYDKSGKVIKTEYYWNDSLY